MFTVNKAITGVHAKESIFVWPQHRYMGKCMENINPNYVEITNDY